MADSTIRRIEAWDLRFPLPAGAGSDARHGAPTYSLAVCRLETERGTVGTGVTLTLGAGNELVTRAIGTYGERLVGDDVGNVVDRLGEWWIGAADHHQLRWLGPHKGVTHLALASVCGALVDAWCHHHEAPLWRLLLEAPTLRIAAMLDPRTLGDVIDATASMAIRPADDEAVASLVDAGYPGYDTSIGWLGYPVEVLVDKAVAAAESGFGAVKVKIGSPRLAKDIERLAVRDAIGPDRKLMVDANQAYGVAEAIETGRALDGLDVFWFEEPVHPDDVVGYHAVRESLAGTGIRVAGGERLPNQVMFKTFLGCGALDVAQPDAVRLGGLPEFLGVSLLAAHHGVPVAPHVGDMGQLHQHLVPFTTLRLGNEVLPLEHIPHLREWFVEPATLAGGAYRLPDTPGASTALTDAAYEHGRCLASIGDRP